MSTPTVPRPLRAPRALARGSHIRVIAPSGPFDAAELARGVERLRSRYRVTFRDDLGARAGFLAGDDARRLAELVEALAAPDVDAIVAARGGYGATRLLDALDLDLVTRGGKLLVGFSDVTALHAAWARAGLGSVHGPMVAALGRAEPHLVERWMDTLEGRPPTLSHAGLHVLHEGRAEGPLVGGNLAVLAALAGTPHAPPCQGAILFLEDIGEAPYRLDRALTTLHSAGWLAQVAGVVLGRFTRCGPGPDGTTAEDVLRERLGGLGVPVVSGLPAGHEDDNLELPLGAPTRLEASASGTVTFLRGAVAPAGDRRVG